MHIYQAKVALPRYNVHGPGGQGQGAKQPASLAPPPGKAQEEVNETMAPPNNPNVAKIALVGHRDTREWVNTFHVHKIGGGAITLADLLVLAPAYLAAWVAAYRTMVNGTIVLDIIELRKLDPSDPIALDYTTGLPSGGALGGTNEAANVSISASWRTGLAGRAFRGRFFVAAINEAITTVLDTLTSAGVTQVTTLMDYLYNAPSVAGPFEPVIFHRATNLYTVITSYVIDAVLDSMRRRLPGRGR